MLQSLKTKKSPLISFPTAGKVKGLTPPEVTTPPTLEYCLRWKQILNLSTLILGYVQFPNVGSTLVEKWLNRHFGPKLTFFFFFKNKLIKGKMVFFLSENFSGQNMFKMYYIVSPVFLFNFSKNNVSNLHLLYINGKLTNHPP